MLSPLLALVATAISLMSLRTSKQALEVGQRAYLSSEVADVVSSASDTNVVGSIPKDTKAISIRLRLTVKNVGNTPMAASASGSQFVETFRNFRWSEPLSSTGSSVDVSAISPRSELIIETPPHDVLIKPSDGPFDQLVRTSGIFAWQDVFGEQHVQTWCYMALVSEIEKVANTGKPLPTDLCIDYLSLTQNPPRGFPRDPVARGIYSGRNDGWRSLLNHWLNLFKARL
jgi:hypothetical protein